MPGRRVIRELQASEETTHKVTASDTRNYLCRLTTGSLAEPHSEIRLKASSYEDAIDKAIRAFRNDPDFAPPPVRATIHAYLLTTSGISDEDAAFRFVLPDDWE